MADYNIKAEITADTSGFESGIKKAQKASKNLSKSLSGVIQGLGKNGLVGALGAVGLAGIGLSTTLGTVAKVAKKVSQTIDECSQAYRNQYKAEIALATAVNNNPYVDGSATRRLKEFASEMQKVSDIGDEEMLPMMADLIAKGRTEDETMKIMSVALDMSASGAMSLDTAITQLNATLNGNVGRLGQQNAELKGLTEEELKNGKAVEILGAKYKGLAQATQDTSKQLSNAIGDFKESVGQIFNKALDPMKKYFTEVLTNITNAINKAREYKTAIKEVFGEGDNLNLDTETENLKISLIALQKEYEEAYRNQQQYLKLYGQYIDPDTDPVAQAYKRDIKDYEERIAKLTEEINLRNKKTQQEKQEAENLKEQTRLEEERAEKEKELAELAKKEAEEKEKALKLQKDWQDKLYNIRIENLERAREEELKNEELTQEQKIDIDKYYGDMILAMKLKQIEKEREEALKQENLTDEARSTINLYYDNKITQAREEENKKRLRDVEESNRKEEKERAITLEHILKMTAEYAKKVGQIIKKVATTIKNVVSKVANIFVKMFEFDPDSALDNLLVFEDSVLTFFVETLPKLPQFFASAMQSIIVLIKTVLNLINFDTVSDIVKSILDTILNGITSIASYLMENADRIADGISQVISKIIQSLADWIESGGWRVLLEAVLKLQKALEQVISDNLPAIVDAIDSMLPDLIDFLIKSLVSAMEASRNMIKPIIKLVMKLIMAVIQVAFSDEVIDASFDVIESFVESLVEVIAEMLPDILKKVLPLLLKTILRSLIEFPVRIASSFMSGLLKAFQKVNWGKFVKDCFQGLIDGFKNLFGIHSPSTVFEGFGENIMQGLLNGLQSMFSTVSNFFTNLWSKITGIFSNAGSWFSNTFSNCANGIQNAFNNIPSFFSGLASKIKSAFDGLKDWFSNLWDNIVSGASSAVDNAKSALEDTAKKVKTGLTDAGTKIATGVKTAVEKVKEAVTKGATGQNDDAASTAVRVGLGILTGGLSEVPHLFGHANGSNSVPRGLALVGEAGPELIRFNGGEQVLNNRNTNKALAEMGKGGNTFSVVFNNTKDTTAYTMMSQLRQYNRQMAINGVL